MNTWRRLASQIGGPYAVTWRAWLFTLPLTVLISSVYTTPPSFVEVAQWTAALIAIHLVLGLLMLVAGSTFLSARPRPPRPKIAIAFFALLGLVRALLLQLAQQGLGIGFFSLDERVVFNIFASVVVFSALAIVIDEFTRDAAITANLESAQEKLSRLRQEERASLDLLDARILSDVQAQVLTELNKQDVTLERMRQISDSIVREVSHELSKPAQGMEWEPARAENVSAWRTLTLVARRMRVPPPLIIVGVYQVLVFGTVVARLNLGFALINILGALPTIIGLWLMRKYVSLPSMALGRLAVLTTGFAIVGIFAAIVNAWMWRNLFSSDSVSIPAVATGVVALSLLVSAWIAVVEGRANRRQQLTTALNEQAIEVAQLQNVAQERRTAAARFLHGTVQNQLIASSIKGDSSEEVQHIITELFADYSNKTSDVDTRTSVESLLASWSAALAIQADIDDSVWRALEDDAPRAALLADVISEALTNAIKHSSGNSIGIEIGTNDGAVVAHMSTSGQLTEGGSQGIGLQDLRQRGVELELIQSEGVTTVVATL